jgi:hypothetical protein
MPALARKMNITFAIIGGQHDGACVDFDIPTEHLGDVLCAECGGEDYDIEDLDLLAGTGKLVKKKPPPGGGV